MLKKLLSLLLIVVFLCSVSVESLGSETYTADKFTFDKAIPIEVKEAMAKQTDALKVYFKLIEFFEKDKFGTPIYPPHYAGEYIDSNNKLVVQLTDEFTDEKVLSYLETTPIIDIKYVDYSYDELISQKKVADKLFALGINITLDYVDILNNKYKIEVLKEDLEKMPALYTRNPIISISEGTYGVASAQLIGGDRIYNEDDGGFATMGICGTYNGRNAVLTCGHGNEKVGNRYPYILYKTQSHRIGQVVFQRANLDDFNTSISSLGDFAIVDVTSSDTMTNDVWQGGQITGTYSSVPIGTTLYKYGSVTGYSWGTVEAVAVRQTYGGGMGLYRVGGLYRLIVQNSSNSSPVAEGDSGGPVWRSDTGENLLHGIVTAYSGNTMYTTPIYYAEYQGFQPKVN